jgi:hypothetical protein
MDEETRNTQYVGVNGYGQIEVLAPLNDDADPELIHFDAVRDRVFAASGA